MSKCDVCSKNGETFVGSSTLGAVSFAYCEECLRSGAEPYGLLAYTLSMFGSDWENGMREEYHIIIKATLEATEKNYDELKQDVAKIIDEENEYFSMMDKMEQDGMIEGDENDDETVGN